MATNYPGAIDSLTNPGAGDALDSPSHAGQHANANDAIEAVQTELGTDPAGASATVKARFEAIEANDWVTSARIAADAVGSSEIAANAVGSSELADNAVDTAAIANGAVTAAKFAVQPGNLLTANQASGGDTLGDTTGFGAKSNCTVARSTAQAYQGSGSLLVTQTAGTYYMAAAYDVGPLLGTLAGQIVTIQAHVRAGSASSTTAQMFLATNLGNYDGNPHTAISTGSWTKVSYTLTVPAGITTCECAVLVQDASGSGTHYLDGLSIHKGAGGTFALPGVPVPGQSRIAVNNAVDLSGTGTPEGVVTAAPGSTWLQTDSTTDVKGWLRWIKATGTGNTGWVAGPEADTGWRDVSASLVNSWSGAAAVKMRRIGERVTVRFAALVAGSTSDVMVVPAGFRPADRATGWTSVISNSVPFTDAPIAVSVLSSSQSPAHGLQLDYTKLPGYGLYSSTLWPTDDAWPTSLPGAAV